MSVPALAHLAILADPTRLRLLLALEETELSVGELCVVLQLPQSTVSRHLKALSDDGWLSSRADGTSRYYRKAPASAVVRDRLWEVLKDEAAGESAAGQDRARLKAVVADRRRKSREYFASAGGEWEGVRSALFGSQPDIALAMALVDPAATVGDLGCGAGHFTVLIAPHVARVIAVDGSEEMLCAARERAADQPNVSFHRSELESLPIPGGTLDLALLSLVLHYAVEPTRVLSEVRRALSPGGRVIVLDMMPHDRTDLRLSMGHVWPGFSEQQVRAWLGEVGFHGVRHREIPQAPGAKGPPLFVAQAVC